MESQISPQKNFVIQTIAGALLGLGWALLLLAAAIHNYDDFLLPTDIYQAAENFNSTASKIVLSGDISLIFIFGLLLFASMISWLTLARIINHNLPAIPYTKSPNPGYIWFLVLLSGVLFFGGLLGAFSSQSNGNSSHAFFGVCIAIAYLLISPEGAAGNFGSTPSFSLRQAGRYQSAIVKGMVLALLAILTIKFICNPIFFYLLALADAPTSMTFEGWHRLTYLVPLLTAIIYGCVLGLVPAISPSKVSLHDRWENALPSVSMIIIAAFILGAFTPTLLGTYHLGHIYKETTSELVNLEPTNQPPRYVLTLGFSRTYKSDQDNPDKKTAIYREKVLTEKVPDTVSSNTLISGPPVPVNPVNIEKMEDFLLGPGQKSVLRKALISTIPAIYANLWEIEKSYLAYERLMEEGVVDLPINLAWWEARLTWLMDNAPVSGFNRNRLERFSDRNNFHIKGSTALRMGMAWHRYGDADKAEDFSKTGKAGSTPYQVKKFAFTDLPVNTYGTIKGKLSFASRQDTIIKVGLLKVENADKPIANYIFEEKYGPIFNPFPSGLTAAMVPDPDGRFQFRNISAGHYLLATMVSSSENIAENSIKFSHHPGLITLDNKQGKIDVGQITLSIRGSDED